MQTTNGASVTELHELDTDDEEMLLPSSPSPEERESIRKLSGASDGQRSSIWATHDDDIPLSLSAEIQSTNGESKHVRSYHTKLPLSLWQIIADPNGRAYRMILLALLCATAFGHMFNYDRYCCSFNSSKR